MNRFRVNFCHISNKINLKGPRQFPKTLPTIQANSNKTVSNNNSAATTPQQNEPELSHHQNHQQQRRSQSVSELDLEVNECENNKTTETSEDRHKVEEVELSAAVKRFERLSVSRSSANNISNPMNNNTNTNINLRASFNSYQSLNKGINPSVEYACSSIKPSQYKQTGIFLPINNHKSSPQNKQQLTAIRFMKEDLELLIQKLRNVQKQLNASSNSLSSTGSTSSAVQTNSLEQFIKSTDEFNDKCSEQFSAFVTAESEIHEYQMQLRQLQSLIKQNCHQLIPNDIDKPQIANEFSISGLSKNFNEFLHVLDKLSLAFNAQSAK